MADSNHGSPILKATLSDGTLTEIPIHTFLISLHMKHLFQCHVGVIDLGTMSRTISLRHILLVSNN